MNQNEYLKLYEDYIKRCDKKDIKPMRLIDFIDTLEG